MEIFELITAQLARLLAVFAAGIVLYLAPKVREWFMSSSDKNTQDQNLMRYTGERTRPLMY